MVPLSHDDLDWNGQSKWKANGFNFTPNPLWFWWGYITGMPGQKNPILVIRLFQPNGAAVGQMGHIEFQPGLFREGVVLGTSAGSYFNTPAGATFQGLLDGPGWHKLGAPGGDPDNLGGPNELTWQMTGGGTGTPSFLYRAGTRAHHMVEVTANGPLLDIRADYVPLIPAVSPPAPFNLYFTGAATAQGTYRGRKVWFMSGWDRFMDATTFGPAIAGNALYQAFVFSGMHPDGRREWGACYVTGKSSTDFTGFAAYCKEGHEPICSHEIQLDGKWVSNAQDPAAISPSDMTLRWTSPDNGESVELHFTPTHSAAVSGTGPTNEVFCDWYEKRSSSNFVRSMAAIEYGIKPGAVPISSSYTPSTKA